MATKYEAGRRFAVFYYRSIGLADVNRTIQYSDKVAHSRIVNYLAHATNDVKDLTLVQAMANTVDRLCSDHGLLKADSTDEKVKYIQSKLDSDDDHPAKELYEFIETSRENGDEIFEFPGKALAIANTRIAQEFRSSLKRGPRNTRARGAGDSRNSSIGGVNGNAAKAEPALLLAPNAPQAAERDEYGMNGAASPVSIPLSRGAYSYLRQHRAAVARMLVEPPIDKTNAPVESEFNYLEEMRARTLDPSRGWSDPATRTGLIKLANRIPPQRSPSPEPRPVLEGAEDLDSVMTPGKRGADTAVLQGETKRLKTDGQVLQQQARDTRSNPAPIQDCVSPRNLIRQDHSRSSGRD